MIRSFVTETLATRVVFGVGSLERLGGEAAALGLERILLVASPANERSGQRVAQALGERLVGLVSEVRQHVPRGIAEAATETALGLEADGLLALGGGSSIGLAKAVALETGLPIVAVPTTYAGSEMTATYGVTGEHKRTGRDQRVAPRTVLYDPALTASLPAEVTATSGMNALAHAVEALYLDTGTPVTDLLAREAVRVLGAALPRAVADPHHLDTRAAALYGAHLAAVVLAQAGTGLHHKLCHVLGGSYGLDHGAVHAVLLPHVTAYNEPVAPRLAGVAQALAVPDAAAGLHALAQRLGAPLDLHGLGLPRDALPAAASAGSAVIGDRNPRRVDEVALTTVLADAYDGRIPRRWEASMATDEPREGASDEGRPGGA